MNRMSKACDYFHLTISTKQTEVIHQPGPGKSCSDQSNTVNGQKMQVVDKFSYLGSTLSRAVHIDDEPEVRKPLKHLADLAQMSGKGMESDLTLN